MFALNQGEVCTCPSRGADPGVDLRRRSSTDADRAGRSTSRQGNPLDTDTMIGAQASNDQLEKILQLHRHRQAGGRQGRSPAASAPTSAATSRAATTSQPTIFEGDNRCGSSRRRSSARSCRVTQLRRLRRRHRASPTTRSTASAPACGPATSTPPTAPGRDIQAGRVWTNCYHAYPAHAAFGGYKQSGIGRENHKMMLDHYQQTKNLLVSYTPNAARLLLMDAVDDCAPRRRRSRAGGVAGRSLAATARPLGRATAADVPPVRRLLRRQRRRCATRRASS